MKVFTILLLVALSFGADIEVDWGYKEGVSGIYGPSQWSRVNAICNGQRQSPINIVRSTARNESNTIRTEGAYQRPVTTTYANDGHGFSAKIVFSDGRPLNITGGPLGRNKFTFLNFHFHWPSEHLIDGKRYAAELHVVHYNTKYDVPTALTKPDGLAVLGIFLDLDTESGNVPPRRAFAAAGKIAQPESTFVQRTQNFPLREFFSIYRNPRGIFSYPGSLTVPTCNEAVTWMVSRTPIPIYQSELNLLQQVLSEKNEPIDNNSRPIQNLNGRKITRYA